MSHPRTVGELFAFYHEQVKPLYAAIQVENVLPSEGKNQFEDGTQVRAFDLWAPVFERCVELESEYYNHPSIDWAKKKSGYFRKREFWITVILGGLIGALLTRLWEWLL